MISFGDDGALSKAPVEMENSCGIQGLESSSTGIFYLCGEPAVIINGLPDVPGSDKDLLPCDIASDVESKRNTGCGKWLEGREVQKLFGEQFYSGTVTKFDKETGWYRVVYEDGDFEDLEWQELEEVLVPLDIMIPLKTLALKIIKRRQKSPHKTGRSVGRPKKSQTTNRAGKDYTSEIPETTSLVDVNRAEDQHENTVTVKWIDSDGQLTVK
ncbi:hypothetical protein RJ641_028268 [Dillenia turbinata]|uniref:PTM/DIR17-like Tudor domain-containing protein n=1 Tax=Dillenia turbinata TaxID=194707 RepID=A0AAN8W6U2_9MAGN